MEKIHGGKSSDHKHRDSCHVSRVRSIEGKLKIKDLRARSTDTEHVIFRKKGNGDANCSDQHDCRKDTGEEGTAD
jgi:hypothetical protein